MHMLLSVLPNICVCACVCVCMCVWVRVGVYVCVHVCVLYLCLYMNTCIQWNLREEDALGNWPLSLVERSSLSRRFVSFFHYITLIHVFSLQFLTLKQ